MVALEGWKKHREHRVTVLEGKVAALLRGVRLPCTRKVRTTHGKGRSDSGSSTRTVKETRRNMDKNLFHQAIYSRDIGIRIPESKKALDHEVKWKITCTADSVHERRKKDHRLPLLHMGSQ
jgi:hypothetical protein